MRILARGKINWTLNVTGVRADGYHLLDMLMQPIALSDVLTILEAEETSLRVEGAHALSDGEDNLALRAARALQKAAGCGRGANIILEKRIPMGAGLGGGSADAAAVLRGLNEMWGLNLSLEALCEIGQTVGADVPFCLADAPCRVRGIGEKLTPIESRSCPLVLLQPCGALSTKEVFSAYHRLADQPAPDTDRALEALKTGNWALLRQAGGNVLESASIPLRPEIGRAKAALYAAGALYAQMTGSGSAVFGAFADHAAARAAQRRLKAVYPVCLTTEACL